MRHDAASACTSLDPAPYRALRRPAGARHVEAIDQRALPHAVVTARIADADVAALAIRAMWIRGAPLIGAVGAYGLAMALDRDASDAGLARALEELSFFTTEVTILGVYPAHPFRIESRARES